MACLLLPAGVARAAAPTLSLSITPATCTYGAAVTLRATIDVPGAVLTVSRRRAGEDAFTILRAVIAGADGIATCAPAPVRTTTYRVDYAGDAQWDPAAAETTVSVRPLLRLSASAGVYQGGTVVLSARVAPAHPGAPVRLQRRIDGAWTDWRTLTLDSESRAVYRWHAQAHGRFAFRLAMSADADHAGGTGDKLVVAVRDANPYGIPSGPMHFVVVDMSQFRLYYHEHGRIVRVFDCVLGAPATPTPLGHFRVYSKTIERAGCSYGPRRMRYYYAFAIHGTNEPELLDRFPRRYSKGCTRVGNDDILWLYARCSVGTQVWNVP